MLYPKAEWFKACISLLAYLMRRAVEQMAEIGQLTRYPRCDCG